MSDDTGKAEPWKTGNCKKMDGKRESIHETGWEWHFNIILVAVYKMNWKMKKEVKSGSLSKKLHCNSGAKCKGMKVGMGR